MEPRSLQFVATACGGELQVGSPQTQVLRVCTDSRRVQPGDLFFALPGERFDGHDFLGDVKRRGAAAVVVARQRTLPDLNGCAIVTVEETRKALGQLAAAHRQEFTLPIIAIGGSNGKTTTKELVASVLRQKLPTLSSEASFNNEIGVPLTLLNLDRSHRAAVLEVGTNHPGELTPLVRMIQPRHGIITSIGREHLEFFGDVAGVAQEQGTLAELLPVEGKLFVPGDSEWTSRLVGRARSQAVRIGLLQENDWVATSVLASKQGMVFRVKGPREEFDG